LTVGSVKIMLSKQTAAYEHVLSSKTIINHNIINSVDNKTAEGLKNNNNINNNNT